MSLPVIPPGDVLRIHQDWWAKCRSCRHWTGDRVTMTEGICQQPKSVLYGQETSTEGYCSWWDAFDLDVALLVLAEDLGP